MCWSSSHFHVRQELYDVQRLLRTHCVAVFFGNKHCAWYVSMSSVCRIHVGLMSIILMCGCILLVWLRNTTHQRSYLVIFGHHKPIATSDCGCWTVSIHTKPCNTASQSSKGMPGTVFGRRVFIRRQLCTHCYCGGREASQWER